MFRSKVNTSCLNTIMLPRAAVAPLCTPFGVLLLLSLRRKLCVVQRPSAWLARLRRSQSSLRRQQLSHFYVYIRRATAFWLATATTYGVHVIRNVHSNVRVFDDRRVVTRDSTTASLSVTVSRDAHSFPGLQQSSSIEYGPSR
ncbi:uncharacterized protein LOC116184999 [Apis dorsata]|uniref:uncharacterized protein LOC116184999 n=1 Tax=Apis dorsata TaxID=7462 RepID=UPI00129407B1|nr:uncharacterized protein LOC116184999 [Apis dorsata]